MHAAERTVKVSYVKYFYEHNINLQTHSFIVLDFHLERVTEVFSKYITKRFTGIFYQVPQQQSSM